MFVQTFTPEHLAIQAASRHDYIKFAKDELINRRRFNYPPFGSVVGIIIRGPEEQLTESVALALVKRLEAVELPEWKYEFCPAPPPISRLRGKYRFHILLQSINATHLGETIRKGTEVHTGSKISNLLSILILLTCFNE